MKKTIASVLVPLCITSSGDILIRYESPYRIILSIVLFVVGIRLLVMTTKN